MSLQNLQFPNSVFPLTLPTSTILQIGERMVHNEEMYAQPPSMTVTPLSAIAEAFEELAKQINDGDEKNEPAQKQQQLQQQLRLDKLCQACSSVSVLFNCLGLVFKFAELEYVSKVMFPFDSASLYGV